MLSLFSCLTMRMGQLCHATLSSSDEPTLLRELWDYFIEKYFTVRFEQYNYQNISVRVNGLLSAQAIIIAFFIGLIIAAGLAMFQKRTLGDLVRALDRENANEPARAMTLEQLGLIRNTAIKQDLRHGTALSVDDEGALVVAYGDGTVEAVNSGEVSIRGMYGYL